MGVEYTSIGRGGGGGVVLGPCMFAYSNLCLHIIRFYTVPVTDHEKNAYFVHLCTSYLVGNLAVLYITKASAKNACC